MDHPFHAEMDHPQTSSQTSFNKMYDFSAVQNDSKWIIHFMSKWMIRKRELFLHKYTHSFFGKPLFNKMYDFVKSSITLSFMTIIIINIAIMIIMIIIMKITTCSWSAVWAIYLILLS